MRRAALIFDAFAILAALAVKSFPTSPPWIERHYSNGFYPPWDRAVRALTGPLPFTVGDVLFFAALSGLIVWWVRALRATPRGLRVRRTGPLVLRTLALVALVYLWFDVSWAFNYERVPLVDKIRVHPERTKLSVVDAFADRVVDRLDATAEAAHREHPSDAQVAALLVPQFDAVTSRLGDWATFPPPRIKPTIFQPLMEATATTGFTDPWTHEVNVDATLFWFERPAIYAHEWSHVAGFADESEANYISVITCTTSPDPLLQYSGWILTYFNLGSEVRVRHKLSKLVAADVRGILARYHAQVKPGLERAQRLAYDQYLKSNRVKAGIRSYRLFVQLLTGADYDAGGLPVVLPGVERAR